MQLFSSKFVVFSAILLGLRGSLGDITTRVSVVRNEVSSSPAYMGFSNNQGKLVMAISDDGDKWVSQIKSEIALTSNPVAVSSSLKDTSGKEVKVVMVFMQTPDGQVSALIQSQSNATAFQLQELTTNLPAKLNSSEQSSDPIQAVTHASKGDTYLFVRTLTKNSQIYWNRFNSSLKFHNPAWQVLGDPNVPVIFDPYAAVNTFLDRVEVFCVDDDKHVLHTWQDGPNSFYGDWKKLGGPFSPEFSSSPVVHQMGHSNFNGVLNLFVRGEDGTMHHISQTTCDKVNNIWGPCTWTTFSRIGGTVPSDPKLKNPFSITHSIHLGMEIFAVGKKAGHLFHVWQKERDSSYSDWEDLGPLSDSSPFMSSPSLLFDKSGWWEAFALDSNNLVTRFVEKPLKFALSMDRVEFFKNVTVTWAIPKDQATHMDWIGVYPDGADDKGYVDFSYVGGSQNPLHSPVPQGSLQFRNALPNGTYNYRYLVNKEYNSVFNESVTVYGAPIKDEWVSLFDGISLGLGGFNTNVSKCADDGEHTLSTFKASFYAFEDRKVFEALHLFAEGLSDFRDALIQCNETDIIKILTRFIEDLVSCTEDSCLQFAIDIGLELIILYEHEYEIYGDIWGATNSFKLEAYEQGGICVGRVTNACLTIE